MGTQCGGVVGRKEGIGLDSSAPEKLQPDTCYWELLNCLELAVVTRRKTIWYNAAPFSTMVYTSILSAVRVPNKSSSDKVKALQGRFLAQTERYPVNEKRIIKRVVLVCSYEMCFGNYLVQKNEIQLEREVHTVSHLHTANSDSSESYKKTFGCCQKRVIRCLLHTDALESIIHQVICRVC